MLHRYSINASQIHNNKPGGPAPELSETLTQPNTPHSLSSNYSQASRTFPHSLGSNTKQNSEETAARNVKNLRTRTHISFILA